MAHHVQYQAHGLQSLGQSTMTALLHLLPHTEHR